MSSAAFVATGCVALYLLFLYWYGGIGKPLSPEELNRCQQLMQGLTFDDSARCADRRYGRGHLVRGLVVTLMSLLAMVAILATQQI